MTKRTFEEIKEIVAEVSDDEELASLSQFVAEHISKKKKLHVENAKKKFFEQHGFCLTAHPLPDFKERADVIECPLNTKVIMSCWDIDAFDDASLDGLENDEDVDDVWEFFDLEHFDFSKEFTVDDVEDFLPGYSKEDYRDPAEIKGRHTIWLYFKRQPFPEKDGDYEILRGNRICKYAIANGVGKAITTESEADGEERKVDVTIDQEVWKKDNFVNVGEFRDAIENHLK